MPEVLNRIPITQPSITDLEIGYVNDAIRNGWGEKCYEYIFRFENAFASYVGQKYSMATSTCTGAIHVGLLALGIKPGDEVIVPDITWIASVAPVVHIGAKPVFVDVLENTWCMDPNSFEAAITPLTKAVIIVNLYGNMPEMDELKAICEKHSILILEDAAESIGSEYKGKKAGSFGDVSVFSFHGTKTMTTGEGGMLLTSDEKLFKRAKVINDHGRNPEYNKMFWMAELGHKYKMSNMQAALGLAQTERIEELVARKREIFDSYYELLMPLNIGVMNSEQSYVKNSYWMPTMIFHRNLDVDREKLIAFFKSNNIDGRPFFYPLSSLPMFEKCNKNIISYDIFERAINLPSFHAITDAQIKKVCNTIINFLNLNK